MPAQDPRNTAPDEIDSDRKFSNDENVFFLAIASPLSSVLPARPRIR